MKEEINMNLFYAFMALIGIGISILYDEWDIRH
jgi:hypothetical protein